MPKNIIFYKITQREQKERFICALVSRIVEKGHKLLICTENEEQTKLIDEWLWVLDASSFLPHSRWPCNQRHLYSVFLHCGPAEHFEPRDVLIADPSCDLAYMRQFSIVIDFAEVYDPQRRTDSLKRFQDWRDAGFKPTVRDESPTQEANAT
ncbi:MAG: DNA polymerase III subunit chi [Myxococcales bacterium]|nr:DNA polymerase III subunit chi [Myxococcales bacterium]